MQDTSFNFIIYKTKQHRYDLFKKGEEGLSTRYTYKLCFFKDAKQSFTRLGSWEGFTSPTEAVFKNGDMCHAAEE